MDLTTKRILVTGGAGFLGLRVVAQLRARGCSAISVPRQAQYNLTDIDSVRRLYAETRPEIVLHLAAVVGGIGANRANPGRFFYDNLMMGVQLMEEARLRGIEKFVAVGTVCSYPKHTPVPFREDELWNGYPEETNAPYGLAKKMLLVQSQAYRQQYRLQLDLPVASESLWTRRQLRPAQQSRDSGAYSQVLRCGARETGRISVWGSGRATREFLFVDDCAEGIVLATERYHSSDPVNIGVGHEISIADLAQLIAELSGFRGRLVWDTSQPDGQPRRCLDTQRAEQLFGFRAKTAFREGLQATVAWYRSQLTAAKT